MPNFYTRVSSTGEILQSCFTTDANATVEPGERLLPDSPPNPPEYSPGITKPVRVEPVAPTATQIEYNIVPDIDSRLSTNEVIL